MTISLTNPEPQKSRGGIDRRKILAGTAALAASAVTTANAASVAPLGQTGAIFSGPICLIFSTRAFWASVSVGMVPIIRVQANGETQLERTLKRPMSSAIDFDSPTMPSLAAA